MARRKDDLTIVLTVGRGGLHPAHPVDLEALSQLPLGTQVEVVKVTKPRSLALVGWWELMGVAGKALEQPPRPSRTASCSRWAWSSGTSGSADSPTTP